MQINSAAKKQLSTQLLLGLMSVAAISSGCVSRKLSPTDSSVKEAPEASIEEFLSFKPDVNWDTVKNKTEGTRKVQPWSDTYWPLTEKGMADRWIPNIDTDIYNLFVVNDRKLVAWDPLRQLESAYTALSLNNGTANLLSPALKYDLLKSGLTEIPEDVKNKLADTRIPDEAEDLLVELGDYFKQMKELDEKLDPLYKAENELQNKKAITKRGQLKLEKLRDSLSAADTRRRRLNIRIDDATRELARFDKTISELDQQQNELEAQLTPLIEGRDQAANKLSEMKKSDPQSINNALQDNTVARHYPMLADGWKDWSYYEANYKGSWGWMGHCHGWSGASVYEAPPKHSVVVKLQGQDLLLTEGDIRGLLTKLWSEQMANSEFAGRRCNTENPKRDRFERVVDGSYTVDGETTIISIREDQRWNGMVVFSEIGDERFPNIKDTGNPKVAKIGNKQGEETYEALIFDSLAHMNDYALNSRTGTVKQPVKAMMQLSIECRDTNPMNFHLALQNLIDGKLDEGLIFDVTPTAQVWNHPVFGYKFKYLPIERVSSAEEFNPAEPTPIEEIDDAYWSAEKQMGYRATGTKFLVQVEAEVDYAVEVSEPSLTYENEKEASRKKTLYYTLELDKNKTSLVENGVWFRLLSTCTPLASMALILCGASTKSTK